MGVRQSSPLCALAGLLLLLMGVISTYLPEVQTRHIDFWCNRQARKFMETMIDRLKRDMVRNSSYHKSL